MRTQAILALIQVGCEGGEKLPLTEKFRAVHDDSQHIWHPNTNREPHHPQHQLLAKRASLLHGFQTHHSPPSFRDISPRSSWPKPAPSAALTVISNIASSE